MKAYGKKKRALLIKFDPAILLKQHQLGEKAPDNPKALAIIKHLKHLVLIG
ncbi:aminoacyltransferase [Streptococcus equi subsp. zooepidemicus]|nr:aminoacyltransferase [Streptococcus equi subsp. zooepidemicus]